MVATSSVVAQETREDSPAHISPFECATPFSLCPYSRFPRPHLRRPRLLGPEDKGLAGTRARRPALSVVRHVDVRTIHAPIYNTKVPLVLVCQGWPDRIRASSPLRPLRPQGTSVRHIRHSFHDTVLL